MASFQSTVLARVAAALYDVQLGQSTMDWALNQVNFASGNINTVVNSVYNTDFANKSNAEMATLIVKNLGVTGTAVAAGEAAVLKELNGAAAGTKGAVVVAVVNVFSTLTGDATYGTFAKAFNNQITAAVNYAAVENTPDVPVHPASGAFNIATETFAGFSGMRLTGEKDVRIDIGNASHQITGLDLNDNGTVNTDGKENNFAYLEANVATVGANHSGFKVVDAYARNPLNTSDAANNFLGNIYFDGVGFAGDGKATNGNIFLGGLAADKALGGTGNDFLAGGGNSGGINGSSGADDLQGGRNADFFFAELSQLSPTDGNNILITGGTTADDTVAATTGTSGLGTQDNDILLLEASDDDEPITYNINEGATSASAIAANLFTAGGASARIADVEGVNASGNLYGFLNSLDTVIGARAYDATGDGQTVGSENYGRGSTGQLIINGSSVANLIIGGYDNDAISGNAGGDLLMGGDLRYLITNKNNPNLLDSKGGLALTNNSVATVNDGKDNLAGGDGNDNIVFESDGGTISGDADTAPTSGQTGAAATLVASSTLSDARNYAGPRAASQGDALWLTNFSMGRLGGATLAGEATAQADALSKLTSDSTYRVDLGNSGTAAFKNYGGANSSSSDQTNYVSITSNNGTVPRVTITGMETVNTTGLGGIDYKAAGSNTPDAAFTNQQNYNALNANVDLRGNGVDNVLLANTGADILEGRGGDDVMSGGGGNDRFFESFGDGVEWIARPVDANGDSLWDTTGGLTVTGGLAWGQDFRPPAAATAGTTTLVVDFGTTVLNGVDTFVATFQVRIDGVDYGTTIPVATLAAAKSTNEVASIVNPVFAALNKNVTVVATSPTTIEVRAIDSTPGDGKLPVVGLTAADGFFVTGQASGAGTYQAKGAIQGSDGTNLEDDRLVIKSYEDRSINLGVDQTKNEVSQAAAMVAKFDTTGSQFVQGQGTRIYLDSVREGDTVTLTINGAVYAYTLKVGETAQAASAALTNVVNRFLDINSGSGQVTATDSPNSFGDAADTDNAIPAVADVQRSGLLIQQAVVLNSQTYMNITATVTRADGAVPFGSVATHNQSNTFVDVLGFDGRNGALTSQDKDLSPVVLFQGRNAGNTTMSLLLTAKNAGGTLNGMDSNLDADDPAGGYINGDDLLFGGTGNDVIDAKTGDDRIIMSKGADTVEGGGNSVRTDTTTQIYQDVLQAEEATFGTGTSFKVELNGTVGSAGAGKGTVTAVDSKGVATTDVTTFSGIELVRVLENNRNSELNLKNLSDNVAAAVGTDSLAAEGLDVLLTTNPSTKYTIDANNNGALVASETTTATAVLGVENLTTGAANDRVTLDQTQATANNIIDLGTQQDNTVLATLREGADVVTVDHSDVTNNTVVDAADVPLRPTLTLAVQGASTSTLAATAGALGKSTFTDTYKNVEIVNLTAAATSDRFNDVLNVSAVSGVTVNYGTAETVGKSLGGGVVTVTTVPQLDGNTLDAGGIALNGTLGSELISVTGINLLEIVNGSAGNDRVIVAADTGMQNVATGAYAIADNPERTRFDATNTTTSGFNGTIAQFADQGLYTFNLAGGTDTLDYRQETVQPVTVSVDTTTGDSDDVFIGVPGAANNRIDVANGVERYFGGTGVANWIDLAAATVATTIEFSKEAKSNVPANDAQEPNGNNGTTVDGLTRAAEVRNSTDNTVYATFVDRTGSGITAASLWQNVQGSNLGETVIFTDNESAITHTLNLAGGANKVDYSRMTTTVNVTVGSVNTALTSQSQLTTVVGANDTITDNRSAGATDTLTIAASARAGDTVSSAALLANGATRVQTTAGTAIAPTSFVDPQLNVINLSTGVVTEALFGQYAAGKAAAFQTFISGFENATNVGGTDKAHLIGDGGRNSLSAGGFGDVIYGGRGFSGDDSSALTAGNRGDAITAGAGTDIFLYRAEAESPGGGVTTGQQSPVIFGAVAPNNDNRVVNSRDSITGFTPGTDKAMFEITDAYDGVRVAGVIPAALAANVAPVTPMAAPTFAANTININIPNNTVAVNTFDQLDNYTIDTPATVETIADLVLRVKASSGSDIIDASAGLAATNLNAASADGLRVDIVYSTASESQAGGFDSITHFTPTSDKIDLSFLKLARYESTYSGNGINYDVNNNNQVDSSPQDAALAATVGAVRVLTPAPVFSANSPAPNLFKDNVAGVDYYKPIALQVQGTAGNESTSVFIDANGDGNYDPSVDMVLVLVGIGGPVALPAAPAGLTAMFVFDQYGGVWGG